MVQDLFLAASGMDLQNASEPPSGTAWAQAARHCQAFLAEAATFFWVKSCNQPELRRNLWQSFPLGRSILEGL